MAYPAQLERATGFEFVNLGASGQCKMEQFFAHVAAACEADAFLFDSFSNPSAQQIEERLEPFVATIRAAHPTTPLIFLQTEVRESRNFNDKIRKFEDDKRAASEAGMQRLLKQDKNIYFLNPGMPLGDDHDATVDGVHPSDLGHGRILEVIRPQIVKILKKHDIR
ncbi:MAG: SGNH/GDSL hydrolase family protein [Alistipes communis]